MAKRSETLELIIRAKEAASKEFKKVGKALVQVRGRMNELKGAVFNLRTAFIGLGGAYAAFRTGKSLIDAASKQKMAVMGLDTVLRSMGRYTPELSAELQDLASSLQQVTNFGDEATIEGQKFLATYRDITDDLLPRSTKTMQDLAALMQGDMVRAANTLGKASMGMVGDLSRIGITVDKQTYQLYGYAGLLRQIESQVKGQARAMREATGPWIGIGMAIGDVKEKLGDIINIGFKEFGNDMIRILNLTYDKLTALIKDADFKKWAKDSADEVLAALERILFGTAHFYDFVAPIIRHLKKLLSSAWEVFQKLPAWVQEVGLVAAIFGGKYISLAIVGVAALANETEKLAKKLSDAMCDALGLPELEAKAKVIRRKIQEPIEDIWKAFAGADTATEKLKILLAYIRQVKAEQEGMAKESAGKEEPGGAPKTPEASADAKTKANLARLKAYTQTSLAILQGVYKDGEKTLTEYFDRRRELMERQFAEEIRLLKEAADAEPDPGKKLAIEAQIYAKREEWKRKQIELTQQQVEAEETLAQKKVDIANILADLRGRAATGVGDGLQTEFDRELAELDRRHQEEIERLRKLNAIKEEIDEAYRSQKLEKDKLLADQERRIFETTLESIRGIAGDMQSFFADLYAVSGEENKKFFELQKTAAIAETIISTYSSAQKAYESMAKINSALAAAAAWAAIAAGMARVAKIRAQTMAAGGQIPGFSPSDKADNIPVWVTAGEFLHPVKTVKYYGAQVMEALRQRLVPKELFAGFNIPVPSLPTPSYALAAGGPVPGRAAPAYSVHVPITVHGAGDPERISRKLQVEIERAAIRVMRQEMR